MPDLRQFPIRRPEPHTSPERDIEEILEVLRSSKEPMWIFDTQTLAFLEVNEPARRRYGYTGEQFLKMTILDIRPVKDVAHILGDELRDRKHSADGEIWRHKTCSGNIFKVKITSHEVVFMGRIAEIVTAETGRSPIIRRLRRLTLDIASIHNGVRQQHCSATIAVVLSISLLPHNHFMFAKKFLHQIARLGYLFLNWLEVSYSTKAPPQEAH